MPQFLQKLTADPDHFVDRLYHMHRYPDRSRLIRYRSGNRLTNPPCRICGKFVTLRVVKLLHRFD